MTEAATSHILSLFIYNPDTGAITSRAGRVIGSKDNDGYLRVTLQKKPKLAFRSHRLAWLAMRGEWPSSAIDHINGCRTDNRWINLRDAFGSLNMENRRGPNKGSTSGYLGVSFAKETGRWAAQIQTKGKNKNLGRRFTTPEQAHQAYLIAKRQLHAGCTI